MMRSQKMIRRKKNVKKGIQFCLMVCGASGTGTPLALVAQVQTFPKPYPILLGSRVIVPDHLGQTAVGPLQTL